MEPPEVMATEGLTPLFSQLETHPRSPRLTRSCSESGIKPAVDVKPLVPSTRRLFRQPPSPAASWCLCHSLVPVPLSRPHRWGNTRVKSSPSHWSSRCLQRWESASLSGPSAGFPRPRDREGAGVGEGEVPACRRLGRVGCLERLRRVGGGRCFQCVRLLGSGLV